MASISLGTCTTYNVMYKYGRFKPSDFVTCRNVQWTPTRTVGTAARAGHRERETGETFPGRAEAKNFKMFWECAI